MAENRLRVGVLGAGRWAHIAHIPGWLRDPRVQLVSLCDVEKNMARDMAAEFGIPEHTDDWQALISRPDVDIIDIVTPSNTHNELAAASVKAGKHVLSEKPVAHDHRETLRLDAAGEGQGPQDQAGLHLPIHPGCAVRQVPYRPGVCGETFHFQRI